MKNYLFVCSANKDRSATAEDYFAPKYPQLNFDSAGTNHKICNQEGTTPLDEKHVQWADVIIVMEQKHRKAIESLTKDKYRKKISVLNIPDHFKYNQKELIKLLIEKTSDFFS
ncbi:MAG: phosphotyrosine protein phosphatase [Crocinitomicaceae bacterium]|nr:phosphotyrosine protein phosphatase [Crocinitomicaceae bacterium]